MARVLFLQDSGINESLAVAELSGVLRASGHDTLLLLGDEERDLLAAVAAWDPALVIVPCPVAGHLRALSDAEIVRRAAPKAVIVLAGTYATFAPELARMPQVDAVLVGEAEAAAAELAGRISAGESWDDVSNLAFVREGQLRSNPVGPLADDLDALPMPDRELYFRYPFMARLPWKKFSTGRGCIHSCTFCWNSSLRDMYQADHRFVRRKSPGRAVAEVREVRNRWPLGRVHFSDDLFTIHPDWLDEFADRYRKDIAIPFTCNTSVPLVSERAISALARAGCHGVAIGIETGNEELRARVLGKVVSDDEIRQAARIIKGHGLELATFNMVGVPGEGSGDVLRTITLNRVIGADRVRVNIAIPLPHTKFQDTAFSLGFVDDDRAASRVENLTSPEVLVNSAERQELVNLYLLFRLGIHFPAAQPLIRRMSRWGDLRPLQIFRLWGVYEEKRLTGLSWSEGLRFFAHVGDPRRRTANYVSLV